MKVFDNKGVDRARGGEEVLEGVTCNGWEVLRCIAGGVPLGMGSVRV